MAHRSRTLLGALALLLCAGRVARTDTIPNVQYSSDTKHWYKVYTDAVSWKTAKANAEALGGYLAVVTSSAEDSFLSGTLGARDKWLGAEDETAEGTWVWVNGETWSYTGWNSGEPNNSGNEDFLSYNSTGTWNDLPTSYSVGYIVEWDRDPNVTDPPQAPSGLAASPTTETRVDLAWTDNSDIELNFELERAVGGGSFAALATLGEDTNSYADTTVLAGGDYSYRVRATNEIGASAWSQTASATTSPPPVSGLAATVLSNRTIELTWKDDSADDEQIAVERGLGASPASFSRIALLAGDAVSNTDAAVSPDTVYSYRLQPLRSGGGFAPSGAVTIRSSPGNPIPGQPVVRDGTTVDVAWQDVSDGETSYEVERGLGSPGTGFVLVAVLAADRTSYRDSTAAPETTYSYRVRAVGPTGPSEWSPEMPVTTPPFAPTGFQVAVVSTSGADLGWTDVSGREDGYRVERKEKDDDRWIRVADLPPGATSYADVSARQDVICTWRVAAFDENGESAWVATPETPMPAALVVSRVSIARPKGTSSKPAKLQATGSFDAGAAAFVFSTPAEVQVGDRTIALTNRRDSRGRVTLEGDQTTLLLKPAKGGSSRVAFTLTVSGDAAAAVGPGATLRIWYRQSGFTATGAVTLAGDRFAAGGTGVLADPPLAVDSLSSSLTPGAKDRFSAKCRFPAGAAPDAAPDVAVRFGALQFTARSAQFKRTGDKWVYSQSQFGARKVTLDYRTGRATFSLAGVEVGSFSVDFDPGEVILTIGGLSFRDRPAYSISKKSVVF